MRWETRVAPNFVEDSAGSGAILECGGKRQRDTAFGMLGGSLGRAVGHR
jgi:hypothetical protein